MADKKVRDIMTNLVVMLFPSDSIHDAAKRLTRNDISGAPVVENGKVVGIVSEADLIHAVMPPVERESGASILDALLLIGRKRPRAHGGATTVVDVMSPVVIQVSPDASIWTAAAMMDRRGIKRLPVVDDEDFLIGIVSRADIVRAMARSDDEIRADVTKALGVLGPEAFEDLDVEVTGGVATLTGIADRKSTSDIALSLAFRTPGVVQVVDKLGYRIDDNHARPRPSLRDPKDPRLDWEPADAVTQA
jgi:CBS domain-containing protein